VYAFAAGRSFYQLFPVAQLHLGWSAIALHWLSQPPATVPGHMWPPRGPAEVQAAFARRSAEDWAAFLGHRAVELRPGCQLVLLVGAADDAGDSGADGFMDLANAALRSLVDHRRVTQAEYGRMVIPTWNRRPADFLAPFAGSGAGAGGLGLRDHRLDILPDAFWAAYQASGDVEAYAKAYTDFFAAAFGPSLLSALDPRRPAADRGAVSAAFAEVLHASIARDPARASCRWRVFTMVIAKPG
jgi:hypothetical protein